MVMRRSGAGGEDLLSAYVDGELDAVQRVAVEDRLERSEEWRAVLGEIVAARDALRGLEEREAPAGFWEQLVERGHQQERSSARDHARGRLDRVRSMPRWAYVAVATAAAVVLAVVVVPHQPEVRPDVATLTNAHAVRASLGEDPIAALAGAAVPVKPGR